MRKVIMPNSMQPYESGTMHDCRLPATIELKEYWQAQYDSANGVPLYRNVELMDLYKIAHLMTIKDVINGGEDFFNRFWGSELCRALGFEATGMRVSEFEPEQLRKNVFKRYRSIVANRDPESRRAEIEHLERRKFVTYEVLHVPFLDDEGGSVSQIMTVFEFNFPLER